jgi:hypothetical protein
VNVRPATVQVSSFAMPFGAIAPSMLSLHR